VKTGFWWRRLDEIPLGRRRVRLEDNINMNPQEIGWGGGARTVLI